MTRETIDFGIDLGTTNSAIALLNGTETRIIKNNAQADFTPSAVWVNRSGKIHVGSRAKERMESDPGNAHGEFKLQMGVEGHTRTFTATGTAMTPEELSAEVLKSLKTDAQQLEGERIEASVITVPAAFELHQCEATRRAAGLAGLTLAPLVQEPTAAAFAYGFRTRTDNAYWLVYDFGGGTFDAAVIHVHDGEFSVVNHRGDNYLGGKLIDWAIVERLLVPAVISEHGLPEDFGRGNPRWVANIARLKIAAEAAKIQLSRAASEDLTVELEDAERNRFQFDFELTRADVERLAEPLYDRSVRLCREALAESRLTPGDVEKVLLVGGTTLAPALRERLRDPDQGLGIHIEHSLDPVTVVARGAAIFAGTQKAPRPQVAPKAGEIAVDLTYEPLGPDTEPLVGGRVRGAAERDWSGYRVEFVNDDARPRWRSGQLGLTAEGTFTTRLWAPEGQQSTFRIELRDASGTLQTVTPDHMTYTHVPGSVPAEAVLTHTVGVGLANKELLPFLRKGATLPARTRIPLRTTVAVRKGEATGLIRIPVLEGDRPRANRNRQVGTLEVTPDAVPRDVPAGSEVEVTIEIDASRQVVTSAYVPIIDQEYEQPIDLGRTSAAPAERLRHDVEESRRRLAALRRQADASGASEAQALLDDIETARTVEELERLLASTSVDPDAAATCEGRLLELGAALDEVEDALRLPDLQARADQQRQAVREIVENHGNRSDRQRLQECEDAIDDALRLQDVTVLNRQLDAMVMIAVEILDRSGQLPPLQFEDLKERRYDMTDQTEAGRLVAEGEQAMARGDVGSLRAVNGRLRQLLPAASRPSEDHWATVTRGHE